MRTERPLFTRSKSELLWHTLRRPLAIGAVAFAAVSLTAQGSQHESSDPQQSVAPVQEQQVFVSYNTSATSTFFDDMAVISVDDPTDTMSPFIAPKQLEDEFIQAANQISSTVDGYFDLPTAAPVVEIKSAPSGRDKVEDSDTTLPCYTRDDLNQIYVAAVKQSEITNDTVAPIVLQADAITCNPKPNVIAYVSKSREAEDDGVFYAKSLKYNTDRNNSVMVHELGHSLGLKHSLAVAKNGIQAPAPDHLGSNDITAIAGKHGNYKLVESYSGGVTKTDEYASMSTVMGDLSPSKRGGDVYNFIEINALDSNNARLQLVDVQKNHDYTLTTEEGDTAVRGIAFQLPRDHPLRKNYYNEGRLDYMTIGLNSVNGDATAELALIGRFADGRTVSFEIGSYIPSLDYDSEGGKVVYTDSALGIRVTATAEKPEINNSDSTVSLRVERIAPVESVISSK